MYDRFQDPKHIKWAKAVKKRDKFTCQVCGTRNTYLNSHHCNSYDVFVDERFDVSNGRTLCSDCHQKLHSIYGFICNTRYQFEEFKKLCDIIKKIAERSERTK